MCSNAASASSPGGGRGWFWGNSRLSEELEHDVLELDRFVP